MEKRIEIKLMEVDSRLRQLQDDIRVVESNKHKQLAIVVLLTEEKRLNAVRVQLMQGTFVK